MVQHRSNEASQRLETIPGIGVIGATAIAATVPDPKVFGSGRDFAAWIGLVPREDLMAATELGADLETGRSLFAMHSGGGFIRARQTAPKNARRSARITPAQVCEKIDRAKSITYPLSRLERRAVASYTQWEIALGPAAKGRRWMTRSVHTATLVVLLCLPVLALSDLAAWAKHHRMGSYFSQPCPDRCNSTRLSICSACMGGTKTCAQQHVCSNNRSVVCGDESTVTVPCWNQRYRW